MSFTPRKGEEPVPEFISTLISATQLAGSQPSAVSQYASLNLLRYKEHADRRARQILQNPAPDERSFQETIWKLVLMFSSVYDDSYPFAESASVPPDMQKRLDGFVDRYFAFQVEKENDDITQTLHMFERMVLEEWDEDDPTGESIRTRYPKNHLSTTDKVSGRVLAGELMPGVMESLAMEMRGSKKQITTNVSIDFDELDSSVQIRGGHSLAPYDREVHNAIVTLYVEGKNRYITPQMIYRVMTGDPEARMSDVQAEAIDASITKCMYGRIVIDCREEARAFGLEGLNYEGMLIPAERVTAKLNGKPTSCIHILRRPVLYDYAAARNQIGRMDVHLLKSPINKNEETIALQGYLQRRILAMRHERSRVSRTIVYDSVFKYVGVDASSAAALRDKQRRLRGQIREILEYWAREEFIAGYNEINAKGIPPKPREKAHGIVISVRGGEKELGAGHSLGQVR